MTLAALDRIIREKEEFCHRCFNRFLNGENQAIVTGYREVVQEDTARIKRYLDEWWSRVKGGERHENI